MVQIKKGLQIKNGYKLKIKIYDKKFSHKYKYTNCNIFNIKWIYLEIKNIFIIEIINDIINTKDLDQKLKSNKVLINRVVKIRMKT